MKDCGALGSPGRSRGSASTKRRSEPERLPNPPWAAITIGMPMAPARIRMTTKRPSPHPEPLRFSLIGVNSLPCWRKPPSKGWATCWNTT
jgi:hypothetical protein